MRPPTMSEAQVRRALQPLEVEAHAVGEGVDERSSEAGGALEQDVSAGEHGEDQALDRLVLAVKRS